MMVIFFTLDIYICELINNLPKRETPYELDLVLEGGAFNGSYIVGILMFLKEMENILNIKNGVVVRKDGLLKNKTFLVTGKLDGISRSEVKSLIDDNSGISVSGGSKKLNYLIVGTKATKRKVENAKNLKINIITQNEFLKMLNKTS